RRHTRWPRDWSSDVCSSDLRIEELPAAVQNDAREAMEKTAGNKGMVLCVALNYGGRAEIVDAMNAILREHNGHGASSRITAEQRSEERRVGKEWRTWVDERI